MKKILFLLLILFFNPISQAKTIQPVIVRDIFYEGLYWAYIPADDDGEYYWRQAFTWPYTSAEAKKCYPMEEAHFGIVRPAKWQDYSRKAGHSGSSSFSYSGWNGGAINSQDEYLEWEIPNGHNRIHLIFLAVSTRADDVDVDLGVSGDPNSLNGELDITNLDFSSYGTMVYEIAVATTSTSVDRILRITNRTSSSCEIWGIHSFDTDGNGDPNTVLAGDGLAMGHDIVDVLQTAGNYIPWTHTVIAGEGAKTIFYVSEIEQAIAWKPIGEADFQWTTYGKPHWPNDGTGLALNTNPTLYINDTSQGTMDDTANVALGELHQDSEIYMVVDANADWSSDGDGNDVNDILNLIIGTTITSNGIGITVHLNWTNDANVETLICPLVPISSTASGFVVFPPDDTETTMSTASQVISASGASFAEIYLDNTDCVIMSSSSGPSETIFDGGNNQKLIHRINVDVLTGGVLPTAGTHWFTGGHINIRKKTYFDEIRSLRSRYGGGKEYIILHRKK